MGEPNKSPNKNDAILIAYKEDYKKSTNMEVPSQRVLLLKWNLYDMELNLVNSLDKFSKTLMFLFILNFDTKSLA